MAEPHQGCDTDDLLMIHAVFRHAFAHAPELVEKTSPKDRARVAQVADVIHEGMTALHEHHLNEDRVLWHLLAERAPEKRTDIERMKLEHAEIAASITALDALIAAWRAAPEEKAELVDALRRFNQEVVLHLDDEEASAKPLAARLLSQSEWNQLREGGVPEIPKDRLVFHLGYLMHCSPSPALRQEFWHALPLPVRLMYRLFGERKFKQEWKSLYGEEL